VAAPYSLSGYARTVGATCKFTLRPVAAQETIWNGSAFETYAVANIATYGITATIAGSGSLLRLGNVPTTTAGLYIAELWELAGGSLALTDDLCGGPMVISWTGAAITAIGDSAMPVQFTFDPTGEDTTIQFKSYYRGAGRPIDCYANPPQPVDVSLCELRIGIPGNFTIFLPGVGRLVAIDAAIGHLRAYPTTAESISWPLEGCMIQLWRTGSGAANTTPMGDGRLKVKETLR
jgi:hypothetical protein